MYNESERTHRPRFLRRYQMKRRTPHEEGHMANKKQTSRRIAALAAHALANPHAGKKLKELAGSALSQANNKRRPSG